MKPLENDFEFYKISTVGDSKVCPICRVMEEKTFSIKDRQAGVNFPPFHPWCRCTFTIEIEDWDKWLNGNQKRILGLSAKIGGENGIEEHDEPIFLKTIDFFDKKQVEETIRSYENEVMGDEIETALVITRSGRVYKCFGIKNRVFPDHDLSEESLEGSIVSHYHPESETTYSFSEDDLKLFMKYNLGVLRGKDHKYTYELNRNAEDIDEEVVDWMSFDNYEHSLIVGLAKRFGVGYRRWKN